MDKKKRIVSLLVLAVMLLGMSVLPGLAEPAAAQPTRLTLDQAVETAIKNSPDVGIAKANLEKTSISYIQARHASRNLHDSSSGSYSENLAQFLTPKIAERQESLKQKIYDTTINAIKLSAESAFYDLIKAKEYVQIEQNALDRADQQLKIANTQFEVGSGSKVDVMGAEAVQAAARAALVGAKNDYRQKILTLNQTMGVDLETQYDLVGTFQFKREEFKLADLLTKALDLEVGLIGAQDAYEISKWTYEFQRSIYSSNNYDVQSSQQDMIKAELGLKQTRDELITNVNKFYSSTLAMEEKYAYLLKTVELDKETYRLKELSYEVGMATSEDVAKASDDVEQAEYDLSDCIYSYNSLKSALKYNIYSSSAGASSASASSSSSAAAAE